MTTSLDGTRVAAFGERLFELYTGAMVTLMIDLAHRTGLLEALAAGAGTSEEVAARAGLVERYVRECLGSLVTAGVVEFDPAGRRYTLPPEHAVLLTGEGSANMAPMSSAAGLLGRHVPAVAEATRHGGGVPYEVFRPEFTAVMDGMSRGLLDGQLLDGVLPLTGELPARLAAGGARVADIGCGTGHSVNLLARAFPRSAFTGYDLAGDALARGRAEAAEWGLHNVSFEVVDVTRLPVDPPFTAVFAFDTVHDQADPSGVLSRVRTALEPEGWFVMMDIRAASALEDNVGSPTAPLLYAVSTLHCMTVSLAQGGAGLGAVWGEQLARRMLAEAGFVDVTVHEVPDDPLDSLYVARAPA
jgi:trans-aconitate methyltransferase